MTRIGLLAVMAAVAVAGCTGTGAPAEPDAGPANGASNGAANDTITVTVTGSGFSPATVRIERGMTVTWVNEGSSAVWPASNQHPTHTEYPGGDYDQSGSYARSQACTGEGSPKGDAFDACQRLQPGESWTFTFNEAGTWGYHNHLAPSMTGTVIVE